MSTRKLSQLSVGDSTSAMEEEDECIHGKEDFNVIDESPKTGGGFQADRAASTEINNPLVGAVDFPFIVTTTDKGNVMLVTDSQTPGYRHHWSVHTRRPHKENADGSSEYVLERFACIKCKQQSRDNNTCMFASCLSVVQLSTGEVVLKTHPWTGIRPHICPGIPADESDACLMLRRKRQDIVKLKARPKDAFDELMREIEEMPGWSEDKKERGRRAAAAAAGAIAGEFSDGTGDDSFAVDIANAMDIKTESDSSSYYSQAPSATATISTTNTATVQDWIENGIATMENSSIGLVTDVKPLADINTSSEQTTSALLNSAENLGIYSMFPLSKLPLNFDQTETSTPNLVPNSSPSSAKRQFSFTNYPQRRIALMFLYLGWEYDGLVAQPDTNNTIEEHLFCALLKTRLIKDRESCQWTRCGRTDKGVSAFKQVAAVTVRSNDVDGDGVFWAVDSNPAFRVKNTNEHNFAKMLNGVLPRFIRIVAWCPTHRDFNARFNCIYRLYTYVFPRANINLTAINDACSRLIGSHDFRNLCHIDNNKNRLEMSYIREIFDAKVESVTEESSEKYSLLKLTVKASGFLWHQIRCLVTVLYEIGCGRESPQLITDLLNITKCPARPQYGLANELPLCLFDCSYPEGELSWIFDVQILTNVIENLQRTWSELQVKASMVKSMIDGIYPFLAEGDNARLSGTTDGLENFTMAHVQAKNYIQMLKRPRCQSLEERIEKSAKRKKEVEDS